MLNIIISLLCLASICNQGFASNVPRIQDYGINMQELSEIIKSRQMLIVFPEKKMNIQVKKDKFKEFNVCFVSSMVIVNTNVDEVKSVVLDFNNYHKFMPQTKYSKILSQDQDHIVSKFKLGIKIPFIRLGAKFVLDYTLEPNGDVIWTRVKGDMKGNIGRWEFVPLSENKTLLIMTFWTELRGIGFIMRLMLRAQPDLELAIPVSTGALIVDSAKKKAEHIGKAVKPSLDKLPYDPEIPLFTKTKFPPVTIQKLLNMGTIVFIHPVQWIKTKQNELIEVKFVTSGGLIRAPLDYVKQISTDFSRFGEFSYQVNKAEINAFNNGMTVDWRLKIGFSIFKFNLDFLLQYEWVNENALKYKCIDGDLEYNYGSWEWMNIGENHTMLLFTTAVPMGSKAHFLLRFSKKIPNSQVLMGASTTAVAINKMVPWIENQNSNK